MILSGFDYWIDSFINTNFFSNYDDLATGINASYYGPGLENDQVVALGGLSGHYDDCSVLRV